MHVSAVRGANTIYINIMLVSKSIHEVGFEINVERGDSSVLFCVIFVVVET